MASGFLAKLRYRSVLIRNSCLFIVSFWLALPVGAESLVPFVKSFDRQLKIWNQSQSALSCGKVSQKISQRSHANYEGLQLSTISKDEADALMTEIKQQELAWNFPLAGCEERAHLASQWLQSQGLSSGKAFLVANENTSFRLRINHPLKPGAQITWKYHVAPLILIETPEGPQPYVLDGTLAEKPMPLNEWTQKMTAHDDRTKNALDHSGSFANSVLERTITPANHYDSASRIVFPRPNPEFDQGIKETLKKYHAFGEDPEGEQNFMFEKEQEEMMLNKMYGPL